MSGVQAAGAVMVIVAGAWFLAHAAVKIGDRLAASRYARYLAAAEAAMRSAALAFDDAWDDVADLFTGPRDELAARRGEKR